ncbi:hypothetical protein DSM107010_67600 [Chroococcidiopsis cubana SAG 39.79]|uniref:Uncharacterized protein n=1 Tax=Chroococcidiopsis cubana SAG 39.79 TaxID=388085 RepID=A0AB37U8R5_9CYAN|nr:hypothetical protein DSM107010_67600 [Chroococcidiopsis cubana SAG 39.79]
MLNDGIDAKVAEFPREQAEMAKFKLNPTANSKAKVLTDRCLSDWN